MCGFSEEFESNMAIDFLQQQKGDNMAIDYVPERNGGDDMETMDKLPKEKGTIGIREIVKSINSGKVKKVIIANNCPGQIAKKIPDSAEVKMFAGSQKELGTKLGKPFPVSAVGYA